MPGKIWILISLLISIGGCEGGSQEVADYEIEFIPPTAFADPKITTQYYGVWETGCFYESDYYPAPEFEPISVYKIIRLEFTVNNLKRIEQRFDDSTCNQYTGDIAGTNFYYSESLASYTVPSTVLDVESGILIGVIESEFIQAQINDRSTVELTGNSASFGRLIVRSEDKLLAGEYAYELDRDVHPLDWTNPYSYKGKTRH